MFAYAIGVTAAGLLGAAGYQTVSPTGQWYGQTFTGLKPGTKKLALTYDDGPNDVHTHKLLDVLAKHGVPATFFLIGRYVQMRPKIACDVAAAGHVIGNHTFTHPNLAYASAVQTRIQIEQSRQVLHDVIGEHSNLFRPPFGGRRPGTLNIVRALGLEPIMWNVTAFDWKTTSAERVERTICKRVRGGNVILLHDGGHRSLGADRAHSVEATDRVIRRYKEADYEFVTIPQMMTAKAVAGPLLKPASG